jgi:hypothetical protein
MEKVMTSEPTVSLGQAKAIVETKTAPRVTEDSIKARIKCVDYLRIEGTTLTICTITMVNGFTFVGKSASASPENFDVEVGKRYAYEDAFKPIWSHEAYLLREQLAAGADRKLAVTEPPN